MAVLKPAVDTREYKYLNYDTGELVETHDELIEQIGPVGSACYASDFTTVIVASSCTIITDRMVLKKYNEVMKSGQEVLI